MRGCFDSTKVCVRPATVQQWRCDSTGVQMLGLLYSHTQGCFVHEWTSKSGLHSECRLTLLYTNI